MADASFQHMVLRTLHVRRSAERQSCLAPLAIGGLQLPSIVERAVSAVARDLLALLNGQELDSILARDSLRAAMSEILLNPTTMLGTVPRAMVFLAGYGIYFSVSTDRTVGRVLDRLQAASGRSHQSIASPLRVKDAAAAQKFCRVGRIANGIRELIRQLHEEDSPPAN